MNAHELCIKRCIEAHEKCGYTHYGRRVSDEALVFTKPASKDMFVGPGDPGAAFRLAREVCPKLRIVSSPYRMASWPDDRPSRWECYISYHYGEGDTEASAIYAAIDNAKGAE